MADYSTFNYGGLAFPLTSSTSNSLLKDADPAIYYALDFLASMLTHHIGARLVIEAAACGASDITAAVASQVPFDAAQVMTTQQLKFPILSVFRISDRWSRKTAAWSHEEGRWGVQYVLPPLRNDQLERLVPILHAAAIVIHNRTEQGWDPSYQSGALVWRDLAKVERVGVTQGSFGAFEHTDNLVMPAWMGELTCTEREMPEGDFEALGGTTNAIDLAQPDGSTTVPDFVVVNT